MSETTEKNEMDAAAGMFFSYLTPEELEAYKEKTPEEQEAFFLGWLSALRDIKLDGVDENGVPRIAFAFKSAEGVKRALPAMQSIHPENAVIPNSRIANELKLLCSRAGMRTELVVGNRGKKDPATVAVTLAYDSKNLHLSKELTGYDREVLNGVCSLFEAGNKEFTPAMVYRAMNGMPAGSKVTRENVEKVTKSINKLRYTHLTIDCTRQAEAWHLPKLKSLTVDGWMISVTGVSMKNHNGEEVDAYLLDREPILYTYSKHIKQVLTVPMRLLDTRKALNTTPEVTAIRAYLIRRIEAMHGQNSVRGRQIRYDTIMAEVGIDLQTFSNQKKKKQVVMDQVDALLQHFKDQGLITDSRRYKEGRAYAGVQIDP